MKTREEIQQEWIGRNQTALKQYYAQMDAAKVARDAALAELEDPMLRLIAAGKRWQESHSLHFATNRSCKGCDDFQSAIAYAEQRRAQG